eukprot:COSAG06_NODE_52819_length_303_cov_1.313725_1_plen_31_part_10
MIGFIYKWRKTTVLLTSISVKDPTFESTYQP